MTSPRLATDSPFGRLYRHPGTPAQSLPGVEESLARGLLVPSVTNVIGCLDKPFLTSWYGKLAAEDAVDTVRKHPGLIESKPRAAVDWLKHAGHRRLTAAAALGDEVHTAVEQLALGEAAVYSEQAAPYVESWRKFVADFRPEFLHLESTCFGVVDDPLAGPLGYAGTADFIARVNGVVVTGDYKSGRSIHSEAALQLAALANARELVLPDDTLAAVPAVEAGLVVHLTPTGYAVRQSAAHGLPWHLFGTLRRVWDFHVANLEARGPLLMSSPLPGPERVGAAQPSGSQLTSGLLQLPDPAGA